MAILSLLFMTVFGLAMTEYDKIQEEEIDTIEAVETAWRKK